MKIKTGIKAGGAQVPYGHQEPMNAGPYTGPGPGKV